MAQLKVVALVVHWKLANANARDDVSSVISDLLIADMSLARACELSHVGSVALLDLVWMRSLRDAETSRWTVAKLLQSERHYYRWTFSQALQQAVRRDDFMMTRWILQHFSGCFVTKDVVEEAARGGRLAILQFLESDGKVEGVQWSESSLNEAAEHGHWSVVRWLSERVKWSQEEKKSNSTLVSRAVKQNKLKQVVWAVSSGYGAAIHLFPECLEVEWPLRSEIIRYLVQESYSERVMWGSLEQAAEVGDLPLVKWLTVRHVDRSDLPPAAFVSALEFAARGGHGRILQWLLGYITGAYSIAVDISKVMLAAARSGKVAAVQRLGEQYTDVSGASLFDYRHTAFASAVDAAASNGHLSVLQFLHGEHEVSGKRRRTQEGSAPADASYELISSQRVMDNAARNGYLDVVKWLHAHRYEGCTTEAMDAAANGHLDVVQWLHRNRSEGCTKKAMDSAAEDGHLEVVQWLHWNRSEGCTTSAIDGAASKRFGYCPDHDIELVCPNAASVFYDNQFEVVRWLRSNRAEGSTAKAMDGAAANGNFDMLRWLHENIHAGCTSDAMDGAARLGRLDIVEWLHSKRLPGCSPRASVEAAAKGNMNILKWLQLNRPESLAAEALEDAAAGGHLQVVKRLLGSTPGNHSELALAGAVACGEFEAALYLQAHQQPRNPSSPDWTDSPYTELHPDIENWILENYGEANLPA